MVLCPAASSPPRPQHPPTASPPPAMAPPACRAARTPASQHQVATSKAAVAAAQLMTAATQQLAAVMTPALALCGTWCFPARKVVCWVQESLEMCWQAGKWPRNRVDLPALLLCTMPAHTTAEVASGPVLSCVFSWPASVTLQFATACVASALVYAHIRSMRAMVLLCLQAGGRASRHQVLQGWRVQRACPGT